MISDSEGSKKLSKVEAIKAASHNLRGTLKEGLANNSTGAIAADDTQLSKFHGLYQQDDRDLRANRRKSKLERAYSFMIRIRVPGGIASPKQYLAIDKLADDYANGTIRLTTRQAFQMHGVLKGNLKPLIQGINQVCMDSIAACGDVNRNVMCNPNPNLSTVHREVYDLSKRLSDHLTPRSRAYHEIWLDEERVAGGGEEEDPVYGKTYLPRKFKIGLTVPPSNDVDIFSQDLGFIAIVNKTGKLTGFNVTAGGGMGMSHGIETTYPRLGDVIGFCPVEKVIEVAEAVVTTQRDYGDRSDRKHARLKYTIADRGVDWFTGEVNRRLGFDLKKAKPFSFDSYADRYSWMQDIEGNWLFNAFILSGRIKDTEEEKWKSALREIAQIHEGDFRLTPNQNLMLAGVSAKKKPKVAAILKEYGLEDTHKRSGLRLNAMACPALPTCGLALSESERFLPDLLTRLEEELEKSGLRDDEISIRMTGCPNGCARPYLGEIGLVGKGPGKYNLYLGARHEGSRLNTLYASAITPDEIVGKLAPIFKQFATERLNGERFGDFCVRTVLDEVAAGETL